MVRHRSPRYVFNPNAILIIHVAETSSYTFSIAVEFSEGAMFSLFHDHPLSFRLVCSVDQMRTSAILRDDPHRKQNDPFCTLYGTKQTATSP
jgi:hypothetical protein